MRQGIVINYEQYNKSHDNLTYLQQALNSLLNSTQAQFEEIKKEKWYNRVFDLITFSQKGKKRVAEQIKNISHAQQILIEMLVRLSENDNKITNLMRENSERILILSQQNIYLAEKMLEFDKIIKYGIRKAYDINKLSSDEKILLVFCIHFLASKIDNPTQLQNEYSNKILDYSREQIYSCNEAKMFEQLQEIDVILPKKIILLCCIEYMFLSGNNENDIDSESDFLYHFDFGSKTLNELKRYVQTTFKMVGAKGIINKYAPEMFVPINDEFFVDFEEDPWDVKRIREWYENINIENGKLHIIDPRYADIKHYQFREISSIANNENIILAIYNEKTNKAVRHSLIPRESVNENILKKLNESEGVIYV